jgi:lipoprotein NlpI
MHGMRTRSSALICGASAALLLSCTAAAQQPGESAQAIMQRAVTDFLAGRVAESVAGFDQVAKLNPAIAPELWQRGIALYYVGRYRDCRAQFESHRTVNPNDVENPVWHFLCVARAESPERARAAILPVGPDSRTPMREVYQMFRGSLTPDAVLAAGGTEPSGQFFAQLYVGLYYDAIGDEKRAIEHLSAAAAARFARAGGYMHTVATLHPRIRKTKP